MKTLQIVLSDQLTHSSILSESDSIFMAELPSSFENVPHHPKKIAFLISAMRHFQDELQQKNRSVEYITLDSKDNKGNLTDTLRNFLKKHSFDRILIVEPSEWSLYEEVASLTKTLPIEMLKDERFFCSVKEFKTWAKGKKSLLMENFYRSQRKKHHILLTKEGKPKGGKWNYDKENRNPLKSKASLPSPMTFKADSTTKEVIELVKKRYSKHFGTLDNFWFGVTHKEAKRALSHFIQHALTNFGAYQDAMVEGEYFLYHSALSQYLNCGLLTPKEICEEVEKAYENKAVPINSAEGFIRQILGWREFVRGVYWTYMPDYADMNALKARNPLPPLYWGDKTDMNCMSCVVEQTKQEAQSHHIQRLMVTGNFALLAGIDPKEVCDWYLAVYADAFDWVEMPNTLGMSLFGDGGIVGTKPYAASGAYINRMSNYCKNCPYNVKEKTENNPCPFNFLYWNFLMKHEKEFKNNPRMKMVLSHLDKMTADEKKKIKALSKKFLSQISEYQ